MGTLALTGVVDHMRATSASLRRYNMPPTPSAISSVSKTFARKPMAAHKQVRCVYVFVMCAFVCVRVCSCAFVSAN